MIIYYYIDNYGIKQGSSNAFFLEQLANQNYANQIKVCDLKDFDGVIHNYEKNRLIDD